MSYKIILAVLSSTIMLLAGPSSLAQEICPITGLPKDGSMPSGSHIKEKKKSTKDSPGVEVGSVAPTSLGKDANKDKVSLTDMRGKVTLISFWDPSCQYCIEDLSVFSNVKRQVGSELLEVVAINIYTNKSLFKRIAKQMKGFDITMVNDSRKKLSKSYGVERGPYLAMIDKDGRVNQTFADYDQSIVNSVIPQLEILINTPKKEVAAK